MKSEEQKLHTPRPSILATYQNAKNMPATWLTYIEDKKKEKKRKDKGSCFTFKLFCVYFFSKPRGMLISMFFLYVSNLCLQTYGGN